MWKKFQVESDDESTKICESCSVKIVDIEQFRELCAVTNSTCRKSKRLCSGIVGPSFIIQSNITQEPNNFGYLFITTEAQNCCASIDPLVTYISLTDDGTDSGNNEAEGAFETLVPSANIDESLGSLAHFR